VSAGGAFAGGGGFDVEPAAIEAGSKPLQGAASGSSLYGIFVAAHAQTAAGAAGAGPLAGVLGRFGAQTSAAATELAGSLSGTGGALEATAQAYTQADQPLAGAP